MELFISSICYVSLSLSFFPMTNPFLRPSILYQSVSILSLSFTYYFVILLPFPSLLHIELYNMSNHIVFFFRAFFLSFFFLSFFLPFFPSFGYLSFLPIHVSPHFFVENALALLCQIQDWCIGLHNLILHPPQPVLLSAFVSSTSAFLFSFLDASSHLYMLVCPSVSNVFVKS